MPITKAKGAIFSIYADSPIRAPTSSSSSSITRQPSKNVKSEVPRKALASLQPSSRKGFPSSSSTNIEKVKIDKNDSDPKKQGVPGPILLKSKQNVKRQHDVLSPTTPKPTDEKHRLGPKRRKSVSGKENVPVVPTPETRTTRSIVEQGKGDGTRDRETGLLDSPAGRTRSKTRHSTNISISNLTSITISSPSRVSRRATVNSTLIDRVGMPTSTRHLPEIEISGSCHTNEGNRSELTLQASGKGKVKGKGLAVKGDGPLADVSEAYGATGEEPEGFRQVMRI
ncbi:hypothetical protein M231_04414 [Tremella mesenterica]|uniref:Uncharacterized protein n=1 Tax=Tremella mesenterica TaxID=5217 RepID=A0A4Q1BL66_TREME|nr:uncharacterized protein TREMEDRAFT_62413 [Tremella mesenterica DSM 1558]EIW69552.1 hypothetical protein TREMEDRAFT_62413 [Tremella mesenterica DSM 1558]RXK38372.1 hypothetical protein M231_04414 [Tremella mesenterica]